MKFNTIWWGFQIFIFGLLLLENPLFADFSPTDLRPYLSKVQNGDLAFLAPTCAGMARAIAWASRKRWAKLIPDVKPDKPYSHVVILKKMPDGSIHAYDTTPEEGLKLRPIEEILKRIQFDPARFTIAHYRDEFREIAERSVAINETLLGAKYAPSFELTGKNIHCGSQVYRSQWPLYYSAPMDFGEPGSEIYEYWEFYFKKLGIPMPTGKQSLNPTGIYVQGIKKNYFIIEDAKN